MHMPQLITGGQCGAGRGGEKGEREEHINVMQGTNQVCLLLMSKLSHSVVNMCVSQVHTYAHSAEYTVLRNEDVTWMAY